MTLSTGKEARLTQADIQAAIKLRDWAKQLIEVQLEWCLELARQVEKRGELKRNPFLKAVMPDASVSFRKDMLKAGAELQRKTVGRPAKIADIPYGVSLLRDISSIPEEHREWAYEEKRTREQIREYKRSLKAKELRPDTATKSNPDLGFTVENLPEKISPETHTNESDVVNEFQVDAVDELHKASVARVAALEARVAELEAEVLSLKSLSTLSQNDINPVHVLASRPTDSGAGSRPELDESSAPPIDWNWHPGLEVGSEACNDFNEICHRISDIDDRLSKYFLTGIFGPKEWAVILGHLKAPSDRANAQRRFRPKGDDRKLIKVR